MTTKLVAKDAVLLQPGKQFPVSVLEPITEADYFLLSWNGSDVTLQGLVEETDDAEKPEETTDASA